jgi:hypothetical protein
MNEQWTDERIESSVFAIVPINVYDMISLMRQMRDQLRAELDGTNAAFANIEIIRKKQITELQSDLRTALRIINGYVDRMAGHDADALITLIAKYLD